MNTSGLSVSGYPPLPSRVAPPIQRQVSERTYPEDSIFLRATQTSEVTTADLRSLAEMSVGAHAPVEPRVVEREIETRTGLVIREKEDACQVTVSQRLPDGGLELIAHCDQAWLLGLPDQTTPLSICMHSTAGAEKTYLQESLASNGDIGVRYVAQRNGTIFEKQALFTDGGQLSGTCRESPAQPGMEDGAYHGDGKAYPMSAAMEANGLLLMNNGRMTEALKLPFGQEWTIRS